MSQRRNNTRGAVDGFVATPAAEFAAFDRLPPLLQQWLRDAPMNLTALAIEGALSQYRARGWRVPPEAAVEWLEAEVVEELAAFGAAYLRKHGQPYPGLASGVRRLGYPTCLRG